MYKVNVFIVHHPTFGMKLGICKSEKGSNLIKSTDTFLSVLNQPLDKIWLENLTVQEKQTALCPDCVEYHLISCLFKLQLF